ncbi:MAG: acylneuraminate cytidylyltransferase family protein [Lachnoclostridium sp.]|jgi:CMP-N-acetylneuraminic acid synthetase|nr:acylneuraminate cytidylyltransferase family protein [Lachnoclostridium sp.]
MKMKGSFMKEQDKILALIPARGGSKGIKNKNIVSLCGKPLISYTIEAAKRCEYVDDIVVTTDSEQIAETARMYGAKVPFLRPKELAEDTSPTIDAVIHALKELNKMARSYDVLVLLQPTSPLRKSEDIRLALDAFYEHKKKGLLSVSPVRDSPVLIRSMNEDCELKPLLSESGTVRRQDMKPYVAVNGGIYINAVSDISKETSFNDNPVGFLMEEDQAVDVDCERDLRLAEWLMKKRDE